MPVVIVDGQEIEIGADERLNCIEVARRAGKEIPHYCWHPGLSVVASCRMCLIETGQRDTATGKITLSELSYHPARHEKQRIADLKRDVEREKKLLKLKEKEARATQVN